MTVIIDQTSLNTAGIPIKLVALTKSNGEEVKRRKRRIILWEPIAIGQPIRCVREPRDPDVGRKIPQNCSSPVVNIYTDEETGEERYRTVNTVYKLVPWNKQQKAQA